MKFNPHHCIAMFRFAREFADTGTIKNNISHGAQEIQKFKHMEAKELFRIVQWEFSWADNSSDKQFIIQCAYNMFPEHKEKLEALLILL